VGPKSPEAFPCSLSPEARSLKSIKIINAQKNGRDGACSRHRHRPSPGNGPLERLLLTKLRGGEFGGCQRRLAPIRWFVTGVSRPLPHRVSWRPRVVPVSQRKDRRRTRKRVLRSAFTQSHQIETLRSEAHRACRFAGGKQPTKQAPHIHGVYGFVTASCLPAPASSLRMRLKACDKMADHSASRTGRVTYIAPFSRAAIS